MCHWCKVGKPAMLRGGQPVHDEGVWLGTRWYSPCTNKQKKRRMRQMLKIAYKGGDADAAAGTR